MALRDKTWVLTQNMLVEGSVTDDTTAVTYDVSGLYKPNGVVNGKTKWTKTETITSGWEKGFDNDFNITWDGSNSWEIYEGVTLVFDGVGAVDSPDLVATWTVEISSPNTVNTAASVTEDYGTPIKVENAVKMTSNAGTEVIVAGSNVLKRTSVKNTWQFLALSEQAVEDIENQLKLARYNLPGETFNMSLENMQLGSFTATYESLQLGSWDVTSPYPTS